MPNSESVPKNFYSEYYEVEDKHWWFIRIYKQTQARPLLVISEGTLLEPPVGLPPRLE